MISLYFLFLLVLQPDNTINSQVIGVFPKLEDCATAQKKLAKDHAQELSEHPEARLECFQLMGTV